MYYLVDENLNVKMSNKDFDKLQSIADNSDEKLFVLSAADYKAAKRG